MHPNRATLRDDKSATYISWEQRGQRQRRRGTRCCVHERGVARARRRCFERRLARTGTRGTGQIRASNEPPRRGLKIDISVFAPSSPRAVRRGAARRAAARLAGFRRLEEVGYAPLRVHHRFSRLPIARIHLSHRSPELISAFASVRPSARLAPRRFIHPPDESPPLLSLSLPRALSARARPPFLSSSHRRYPSSRDPRPLSPRRDERPSPPSPPLPPSSSPFRLYLRL